MTSSPLFYQTAPDMPVVASADGVYIRDSAGREYLDGCAGAICANLGHGRQDIRDAMLEQLDQVAFTYRTQFENEPAIRLAYALTELTNGDLEKVFFVSSGSEAMEAAIKLARQYFVSIGEKQRTQFISLRPSYHGSTLGALGLTGYQPLEAPFSDLLKPSTKVPGPDFYRHTDADDHDHVKRLLEQTRSAFQHLGPETVIALAVEPIGGASTGARLPSRAYLRGLRELCDEYGALLIYDEVLTGLGRTGRWFAYQHYDTPPDLLAVAKGLGAGYYPVGAVLARHHIVDAVLEGGGFPHGHTYAGNPLACATGLAVIEAIRNEGLLSNVTARGKQLRAGLQAMAERHAVIGDIRGEGLLYGVELVADRKTASPFPAADNIFLRVTRLARDEGLLIYPRRPLDGVAGDHFLVSPPFTISAEELDELLARMDRATTRLTAEIDRTGST
mgnify:CR=1 FL=1